MHKEAKLRYGAGSFDILTKGDYVTCAVSKKKIELQEAYFSPAEVAQKFNND